MEIVNILNSISSVVGVPCVLILFWFHTRIKALEDKHKSTYSRLMKLEDKSNDLVNDLVEIKNDIRWIRTLLEKEKTEK